MDSKPNSQLRPRMGCRVRIARIPALETRTYWKKMIAKTLFVANTFEIPHECPMFISITGYIRVI